MGRLVTFHSLGTAADDRPWRRTVQGNYLHHTAGTGSMRRSRGFGSMGDCTGSFQLGAVVGGRAGVEFLEKRPMVAGFGRLGWECCVHCSVPLQRLRIETG